ncbi:hypothetical protein L208DRAFT_1198641, partial [Tricholoma matsutake]
SFGHAPCNSAEKISSSYKASEFLVYLFCLGPGLFYCVLPQRYWCHFCQPICAVQIIHQHKLTASSLAEETS